MAVIQARKNKKGTTYQISIRARDGHPPWYKNFPTKEEAKHWAKLEESRHLQESYLPNQAKKKYTLTELGHRHVEEVLPSKTKNAIKDLPSILSFLAVLVVNQAKIPTIANE